MIVSTWFLVALLGAPARGDGSSGEALRGQERPGGRQRHADRKRRRYPPEIAGAKVEVYKTVGDVRLNMYIFSPPDHRPTDRRAAIVFFFGGGWRSGTPTQFEHHSRYLAGRGMLAFAADYRVSSRHSTRAVHCVQDAKSAVRWIRSNAKRLGVDPRRIAAGGGSAGGHIAACTGVIRGLEEPGEKTEVSSVPDALVLYNPALVLASVDGKPPFDPQRLAGLKTRLGAEPQKISPYHHVRKGAPPTIIFHGTADRTVKFETAKLFTGAMKKAKNRCRLVPFEGRGHGFFNHGRGDGSDYVTTVRGMDEFLIELGFLEGKPTISAEGTP